MVTLLTHVQLITQLDELESELLRVAGGAVGFEGSTDTENNE